MEATPVPETKGQRGAGWMLVVLGPLLSIAMAVLAFYLWRTIHFQGQPGAARWTGSPAMTARAFQLFGTIFVFGLVGFAAGIFQIRTGRRNFIFLGVLLALVAVMFFLGREIMQLAR